MLPDVIEEGLDVFINEDHQDQTGEGSAHRPPQDEPAEDQQDQTGEGSAHRPPQDEPAEDQQDQTGEGSAHRPPQDQPKLLTAFKGIFFRKQIVGRYISVLLNCLNYILK